MKATPFIFLSTLWLAQVQAMPLPLQSLKSYDCESCADLAHESLSASWAISDQDLTHNTKHQQISRKYQIKVILNQLYNGVAINTLAPAAIIRISPVRPQTTTKPEFRIKNSHGLDLTLMDAASSFSKEEALQTTPFAGQALALLELKPELGFGEFILTSKAMNQANKDEQFIIHVFDKSSTTYLSVETDKARYQYGDKLSAIITLRDNDMSYPIDRITANLVNPEGELIPLNLEEVNNDHYQAQTTLLSEKNSLGENWYLEIETTTLLEDQIITRQVHTAFSYVIPSAAIREVRQIMGKSFNFSAIVETATDSRYALQAVLFGSDKQGKIHPIQTAQSAAWFRAGRHKLNFSFDPKQINDYKAPYYLGYLHLTDFGQLKPVYEYNQPITLTKLG